MASHTGKLISLSVLCVTHCSSWERPCFTPIAVSSHLILPLALDGSFQWLIDWLIIVDRSAGPLAPRVGGAVLIDDNTARLNTCPGHTLKTNLTNPKSRGQSQTRPRKLHYIIKFLLFLFFFLFFIPTPLLQHPAASKNVQFLNQSINQSTYPSVNWSINQWTDQSTDQASWYARCFLLIVDWWVCTKDQMRGGGTNVSPLFVWSLRWVLFFRTIDWRSLKFLTHL